MKAVAILTAVAILSATGVAIGDEPGELKRLPREGSYTVQTGDLVLIALESNPSTGPNNPASNLKVEIKGSGLAKKAIVVFSPPAKPIPGAPGEIQAYIHAEGIGEATITVTPINGAGKPGSPMEYKIKVEKAP